MDAARLRALLDRFPAATVLVVGDFFLDKYLDIDARLSEPSLETGLDAYQVVGVRDDEASEAAGEHRYPSLLDIQPATREAIRIPAPQHASAPEAQQGEPIVMFPSAAPRADAPFAPPPASTLQSRRSLPFQAPMGQAPGGGNAGMPVTPPELPADPVDAEEADRALRAALATLQRMSGGR